MLRLLKYSVNKRVASPVYLIHFVTNRCNAKCPHCFIDTSSSAEDELTIGEIEKISRTFSGDIFNVNLTGGEPFIRDDIPRIIELYFVNAGVRSFLIATNGFYTEKIKDNINAILGKYKGIRVVVVLSIDHIGDEHDRLRGVKGLYDRVISLYRDLDRMADKRLSVGVNVTIQRDNYKDIIAILNQLIYKEKISNTNITLTRGRTSDDGAALLDAEAYIKANRLLDAACRRGLIKGLGRGYMSLIDAKNQISRRVIGRIIKDKSFVSECFAGSILGVMYPNGDVYPCELYKEKIGNIRDFNYNFRSLWTSDKTRQITNAITRDRCFCTYECAWTTNILFNPRYYPELLARFARSVFEKIGR